MAPPKRHRHPQGRFRPRSPASCWAAAQHLPHRHENQDREGRADAGGRGGSSKMTAMISLPRELLDLVKFELVSWHDALLSGFHNSPLRDRADEVAALL